MRSGPVAMGEWTPDIAPVILAVLAGVVGISVWRGYVDTIEMSAIALVTTGVVFPLAIRTEPGAMTFRYLLRPSVTVRPDDVCAQRPAPFARVSWHTVFVRRATGRLFWPVPAVGRAWWLRRAAVECGFVLRTADRRAVSANVAAFTVAMMAILFPIFACIMAFDRPR